MRFLALSMRVLVFVIVAFVSNRGVRVVGVVGYFIMYRRVLLVCAGYALAECASRASSSTDFEVLSMRKIGRLYDARVVCVGACVRFYLSSVPGVGVDEPFSAGRVAQVFRFVRRVAYRQVYVEGHVATAV